MKPEEKIERAYEELRSIIDGGSESFTHEDAVQYLKDKLAQPEQEPVAFDVRCYSCGGNGYEPKDNNYYCSVCNGSGFVEKMLYTTPPQRTWVGLTDAEVKKIAYNTAERKVAKDIEAKLKEKNDC